MSLFALRLAPGHGAAVARKAARFYFLTILLVASTIYPLHPMIAGSLSVMALALCAAGMTAFLYLMPWNKFSRGFFTFSCLFPGSILLALLVYFTGGLQSSYGLLFFLIVLFSYFKSLIELYAFTTMIAVFYALPLMYSKPQPHDFESTAITVLFFYLGTYLLYSVRHYSLKKNQLLVNLNMQLSELYSISSGLLKDLEVKSVIECLSERLKDHICSTYCILLVLDDERKLTTLVSCSIRSLASGLAAGSHYPPDALRQMREVFGTRHPKLIHLETDAIDDDFRQLITRDTRSVLVVPIRIAGENVGLMLFGEERHWKRAPYSRDKIQLAVAIGRQVAIALELAWCYERLEKARHNLHVSQEKVIKAERLATLGEVTRAVEHEINNPLNVIVNWAEIYREDETIDPVLRKKFQIIYDMTMRIVDVIKRLASSKDARAIECVKGQKMTDIE